jgi:hypothetical protein
LINNAPDDHREHTINPRFGARIEDSVKAEVFGQLQQDAKSAVFLETQDAESVRITDRLNLIPKGGLQEPELLKRAPCNTTMLRV